MYSGIKISSGIEKYPVAKGIFREKVSRNEKEEFDDGA